MPYTPGVSNSNYIGATGWVVLSKWSHLNIPQKKRNTLNWDYTYTLSHSCFPLPPLVYNILFCMFSGVMLFSPCRRGS